MATCTYVLCFSPPHDKQGMSSIDAMELARHFESQTVRNCFNEEVMKEYVKELEKQLGKERSDNYGIKG